MFGRRWEILVVDDDPDFLWAAKRVLGRSPHMEANVQTTVAPDEALRLVAKRLYDVVLADWHMAPDDGRELLRQMHESKPSLRRVLLTGYDPGLIEQKGVDAEDADLVLDKNDLLDGLDKKLSAFLESRR